jgi:hypothetical protein
VGYYTYVGNSVDAAGNVSTASVTRVRTYDPVATTPALTTALFSTPLTGSVVTFNANGSDDFDLWKVSFNLTYGGLVGPVVYPSTILQTFNQVPFVNTNVPTNISITGFMRQVENVTSVCNAALTVGGAFKPVQLQEALLDMANLTSGPINTVIPGTSVTTASRTFSLRRTRRSRRSRSTRATASTPRPAPTPRSPPAFLLAA